MRLSFTLRNNPLWTGLFLVAMGAAFLALSWMSILLERQYQREGRTVDGVVLTKTSEIKRRTRTNSDVGSPSRETETKTEYTVTYQFTAVDGRAYEDHQRVADSVWNGLQERGPISVQYLASAPSTNRLAGQDGEAGDWIFVGVGALLALIGGGLLARLVLRRGRALSPSPAPPNPAL